MHEKMEQTKKVKIPLDTAHRTDVTFRRKEGWIKERMGYRGAQQNNWKKTSHAFIRSINWANPAYLIVYKR